MGTFVVALVLAAVVILISRSLIRDRKRGKCSCGGSCGACSGCAKRRDAR